MTTDYRYHIAILIPAAQKDAANQGAAALTGRPPDEHTFRDEPGRRFTDDDGEVYLLAGPTPMKDEQVAALPMLASQFNVDAQWETIARWEGERVPVTTVEEWAGELGLVREAVEVEEIDADDGLININTATVDELTTLSGVGPSLAQKIIDDRPYEEVDDMVRVSGISQSMVDDWREGLTV